MCQPDRAVAPKPGHTSSHLDRIARLLGVPVEAFVGADVQRDEPQVPKRDDLSELFKLFAILDREDRLAVLALARRLAR